MKYRLEKLNQVQYADDELRRKELEAKGFHVVSGAEEKRAAEIDATEEKPKTAKKAKTAKKTDTAIKKAEPAEGEEKDAR